MKVLHLLRDPADPRAAAVIGAEVAQGVEVGLLLLGPGAPPPIQAPVYRLADGRLADARLADARLADARLADARLADAKDAGGATPVDWSQAVELIFRAGSVVAW